ncbi:hypothetical protein J1N35_011732 [Gossypium stocksii]|uniref:Uncharacterized protein n=1 Tax=Gossypium stocksii TaxID=47602 RepID=A0A9D3W2K5_9ROSI|nr:hypothetical protein J1N35_011732 [Gossypium stocksii]
MAKCLGEVGLEDLYEAGGSTVSIEEATHIYQAIAASKASDPDPRWTYRSIVLEELSVVFHKSPSCILDNSNKLKPSGAWLPGAVLNIAKCSLLPSTHPTKEDNCCALVWREEGRDDLDVNRMTLKELREPSNV